MNMNRNTVKKKSGFLAIGAYGGNQCVPFYKKGYSALFVNTALQDLDSLTDVDDKYKYHIPGGEGCNKDRGKSKAIFKKDIDNIVNQIKEKMPGIEYLFIVGSAGGGTASGVLASMKRVAMNSLDLKACILVTVLPNTKLESVKTLINCYETLAEIEELISTPGMAIISKLGKDKSETQQLISTFHNNIYAPMEEDKIIKYIGLINAGNGKEIQIEDIYEEVGVPLDCFTGFESDSTVCMLAGLSLCYGKMAEIKEKIDANRDTIKLNLVAQRQNRLTDSLGFFDEAVPVEKVKPKKKESNRDLLF